MKIKNFFIVIMLLATFGAPLFHSFSDGQTTDSSITQIINDTSKVSNDTLTPASDTQSKPTYAETILSVRRGLGDTIGSVIATIFFILVRKFFPRVFKSRREVEKMSGSQ